MPSLSPLTLVRLRTGVSYLAIISLGMCTSIVGPTLRQLERNVSRGASSTSAIYLFRSIGYLLGSFGGGVALDYLGRTQLLLFIFTFVMNVCTVIIPFVRDISLLFSVMALSGFAMGAQDTGLNVWCLTLWEDESSPYFQALHFFFGIGAWLGPTIAAPFLLRHGCSSDLEVHAECLAGNDSIITSKSPLAIDSFTNGSYFGNLVQEASTQSSLTNFTFANATEEPNYEFFFDSLTSNASSVESDNCTTDESAVSVIHAYGIIGLFGIIVTMFFVCLFFVRVDKKKEMAGPRYKNPNPFLHASILLTAFLTLSVYAGIEIGFGQMLSSYASRGRHQFSESAASYITSLYWGTFTFSRGLSILLTLRFSPASMVAFDCVLMAVAAAVLEFLGNQFSVFLWLGSGLLGFALASFYPSIITWVESYVNVNNKVGSSFVVAASLGEMVAPLTVSQFLACQPQLFLRLTLGAVLACSGLVLILHCVTRCAGRKRALGPPEVSIEERVSLGMDKDCSVRRADSPDLITERL